MILTVEYLSAPFSPILVKESPVIKINTRTITGLLWLKQIKARTSQGAQGSKNTMPNL